MPRVGKPIGRGRAFVENKPRCALALLERAFVDPPLFPEDENLLFAVDRIYDVIQTMNNNVFVDDSGVPRFGGFADHDAFPVTAIPDFRDFLDKRGQAFLEEIDDWLAQRARLETQDERETARVGISLFATERQNSQE